ncbi:hypothetical protein Tco_0168600 [Tanacetum coccineum]
MWGFTVNLAYARSEYLSRRNPPKTNSIENFTLGFPPKIRSRRRFLIHSGRLIRRKPMSYKDLPTSIIGEPLSPDCVFDFPVGKPEPHLAYDFFAPGPLPGYAGDPNNNNGWLEADDYLLGELEAMVDKPMVVPAIEEVAEPVAEAEEEQMDALVIYMGEDLVVLFGDDDFEDDASDGFDEEEVWEVNEEWLMAPTTPPPMPTVSPPSVYEVGDPSTAAAEEPSFPLLAPGLPVPPSVIEDLSTRLGNLEYGHGQLVKKVIQVSDAEVAAGVSIGEIGPRVFAMEGQMQVEQGQQTATQRDETIAELTQQCILGLERQLAALERRPPGPW